MIHDLKKQGLSLTAIARKVGCDRKTVRKYLERGLEGPAYGPRQPRDRLVDPYETYLRERVLTFPDLSGARLLREIRDLVTRAVTRRSPISFGRSVRRHGRSSSAGSRPHRVDRRRSTSLSSRSRSRTSPASRARSGCSRSSWVTVDGSGAGSLQARTCNRSCAATSPPSTPWTGFRRKSFMTE